MLSCPNYLQISFVLRSLELHALKANGDMNGPRSGVMKPPAFGCRRSLRSLPLPFLFPDHLSASADGVPPREAKMRCLFVIAFPLKMIQLQYSRRVRFKRLPEPAQPERLAAVDESQRQLLRQCPGGKLFRQA